MEQRIVGRKNNSTLPRSTKALSLERTRESVWLEEIDRVICHRIPRLSVPSPLDDYHAASDFAWGYRENRGRRGRVDVVTRGVDGVKNDVSVADLKSSDNDALTG